MSTDTDRLAPLRHRNRWQFSGQQRPDGEPSAIDLHRPALPVLSAELRAEPAPVCFDPSRSALVVVDLQNDFCSPGGWLAGIGVDVSVLRAAIGHVATLLPHARDAGVPIIWLNWGNRSDQANIPPGVAHVYDPNGTGEGIGAVLPDTDSRVLTKGSWGAALIDGLPVEPDDVFVDKYRMSGFWDTPLDSILRNLRVDTLLFAGVNSDQCVYATLSDAACLGYDVILLTDASATTSPDFCHAATIYNTRQCFGFTTTTTDLVAALGTTVEEETP